MAVDDEVASRTRPPVFEQHADILLAVPPVLVVLLAMALFAASRTGTADYTKTVHAAVVNAPEPAGLDVLRETRARYAWFSSLILYLVVVVVVTAFCGWILWDACRTQRLHRLLCLELLLCAAGLAFFAYSAAVKGSLARGVYEFTFGSLRHSPALYAPSFLRNVRILISVVNVLAVVAPVTVIAAACSTLSHARPEHPPGPEHFARQLRRLKTFLNASSLLLFAGILHMGTWLHWPTALVADKKVAGAVAEAALSITAFWGTTCSLLIAVTYFPAALLLGRQAQAAIERTPQEDRSSQEWLREQGFTNTPLQVLRQAAVIFAPLVAAPLSDVISKLVGTG